MLNKILVSLKYFSLFDHPAQKSRVILAGGEYTLIILLYEISFTVCAAIDEAHGYTI